MEFKWFAQSIKIKLHFLHIKKLTSSNPQNSHKTKQKRDREIIDCWQLLAKIVHEDEYDQGKYPMSNLQLSEEALSRYLLRGGLNFLEEQYYQLIQAEMKKIAPQKSYKSNLELVADFVQLTHKQTVSSFSFFLIISYFC